jgi:hypothetical protein
MNSAADVGVDRIAGNAADLEERALAIAAPLVVPRQPP